MSVVGLEAPGDPTVQWARRWSRAARSDLLNGVEVFDHALIHVSSARIAQDNDYGRLGLWLRSPTRGLLRRGSSCRRVVWRELGLVAKTALAVRPIQESISTPVEQAILQP